MGGLKNIILVILFVFIFVVFWYDLLFKLFVWGWLVSLFFVFEILVRKLFVVDKVCGGFYVVGWMIYYYD